MPRSSRAGSAAAGRSSTGPSPATPQTRGAHLALLEPRPAALGRPHDPPPAREGAWWDAHKVGLCAPPLETPDGWLLLYHGVHTTAAGSIYRLGLALLDAEQPDRVLARSTEWLFGPDSRRTSGSATSTRSSSPAAGSCSTTRDTIRIYYGAADTSICVATASQSALLAWLSRHSDAQP